MLSYLIKPGKYKHYDGKIYTVIGTAKHPETEEELVVCTVEKTKEMILFPRYAFSQILNIAGRKTKKLDYLGPDYDYGRRR